MNKLALGAVQFGLDYGVTNNEGKVQIEEVKSILECAKENSINTLDTAASYGNSEEVLGGVGVNDFQVITKTIPLKNGIDEVIKRFQQSLTYLNKSSVNGLLIHNINEIEHKNFNTLFKELTELKQQGLVNKIGFSTYTPEQVDFLLNNFDFDLIQVPFNILDNRLIQSGQFKALNNKGIEVHARSVFLQGLLLMSKQSRPSYFKRWGALWKIWHEWLNDNQITALEATIRHAISMPEISKVLVGVDNVDQLKEIVTASPGMLPNIPDEMFTNDADLLNPSNWGKL
jgi:aryl-alcohol dehydrogenase-like predicted oxidoreductase